MLVNDLNCMQQMQKIITPTKNKNETKINVNIIYSNKTNPEQINIPPSIFL